MRTSERQIMQIDRDRSNASPPRRSPARGRGFPQAIVDTMQSAPRLATFLKIPLSRARQMTTAFLAGAGGLPRILRRIRRDRLALNLGHQIGAAVLRGQDLGVLKVLLGTRNPRNSRPRDCPRPPAIGRFIRGSRGDLQRATEVEEMLTIDFTEDGAPTLAGFHAFALYVTDKDFPGDFVLADREDMSKFAFLPRTRSR